MIVCSRFRCRVECFFFFFCRLGKVYGLMVRSIIRNKASAGIFGFLDIAYVTMFTFIVLVNFKITVNTFLSYVLVGLFINAVVQMTMDVSRIV